MSNKILFVSSIKTHFLEFKRYYSYSFKNLKKEYELLVIFNFFYIGVEDDIEFCKKNKLNYYITFKYTFSPGSLEIQNKKTINQNIFFTTLRTIKWILYYKYEFSRVKKFILKNEISLLIICEDSIPYGLNIFSSAAKNLNIKTLIFPFTIPNSLEFLEQIKNIDIYKYHGKLIHHRILKKYFLEWLILFENEYYFRAPIWQILALELLKIAPQTPWINYNEYLTTIAVENDFMYKHYINYGISKERLVLTGSLVDDKMFEIVKYNNDTKSENSKLKIVCAFPPPQIHYNSNYNTYVDLVKDLIESFKPLLNEHEIIFKMHPRVDKNTIELLKNNGFIISDKETFEIIAECNVYIAFISATIRWALNLNIPILNFDIYNYNYNDFLNIDNVHNVYNIEQFRNKLNDIITNRKINDKLLNFILDGNSTYRINNLITNLTNARKQ